MGYDYDKAGKEEKEAAAAAEAEEEAATAAAVGEDCQEQPRCWPKALE